MAFFSKRRDMRKIKSATGEVTFTYQEYLTTSHWRNMRSRIAKERGMVCEVCKKDVSSGFEMHHKSYARVEKKKVSDLQVLCHHCHDKITKENQIKKEKRKLAKEAKKKKPTIKRCPRCHARLKIFKSMKFCPKCDFYCK